MIFRNFKIIYQLPILITLNKLNNFKLTILHINYIKNIFGALYYNVNSATVQMLNGVMACCHANVLGKGLDNKTDQIS